MTTAHRPTFDPARGGTGRGENDLSKLSTQYSARDLPGNLKLKYREPGQAHPDEVRDKNLRFELEEKELEAKERRRGKNDVAAAIEGSSSSKKPRLDTSADPDADDPVVDSADDDSDDDDDDDSEDDEVLMAELERIKRERAEEKARKEEEAREEQERVRKEAMLTGNPMLNLVENKQGEFKVKRRWDEDVVFKNCAKGLSERKKQPTFINDSLRSEFHRKFMDKYIK